MGSRGFQITEVFCDVANHRRGLEGTKPGGLAFGVELGRRLLQKVTSSDSASGNRSAAGDWRALLKGALGGSRERGRSKDA